MAADLLPYKVVVAAEVVGAVAVTTDGCECEVKFAAVRGDKQRTGAGRLLDATARSLGTRKLFKIWQIRLQGKHGKWEEDRNVAKIGKMGI